MNKILWWQKKKKLSDKKLEGVGPVDNRPSLNKLLHVEKKKCDTCHLTRDTWHMTHDTWDMTPDMWHVVGVEHSLKIVCDLWYVEDMEEKGFGLN